jgi:hypothetical protein
LAVGGGDYVQEAGKPLRKVIMIHSGSASVHNASQHSARAAQAQAQEGGGGGGGGEEGDGGDVRKADLSSGDFGPLTLGAKLYTYQGAGRNGCVIGGTVLGDRSVMDRAYPNHIICDGPTKCIEWDVHELLQLLRQDRVIESAFLHSLYVPSAA